MTDPKTLSDTARQSQVAEVLQDMEQAFDPDYNGELSEGGDGAADPMDGVLTTDQGDDADGLE